MAQSRFFLRRAVRTATASMERWLRAKNLINEAAPSFAVFGPAFEQAPHVLPVSHGSEISGATLGACKAHRSQPNASSNPCTARP
ncbi:hypothetical protein QCE73_14500 [Caballeronia sp. LZ029]|jgi:hypothetical protein|nr:hypothetical protein [Caballeronia sp. LZ029]KAK48596.1 hypothetical protein BG58_30235 [Caballeronia jiangsuensis]MDR5744365.1 hypothetical protein [Caballeronia sp. LZ029]